MVIVSTSDGTCQYITGLADSCPNLPTACQHCSSSNLHDTVWPHIRRYWPASMCHLASPRYPILTYHSLSCPLMCWRRLFQVQYFPVILLRIWYVLSWPNSKRLFNDISQIFKCYSIETLYSAQLFSQDLKLGHYIKIPPRTTFMVQLTASCLSVVTQIAVKQWLFSAVKDICSPNQKDNLTCPRNWVYFNASAIWYVSHSWLLFGTNGS